LAGGLAADMVGYRQTGYVAATDDEIAADAAGRALAALSPRHRDLLDKAETRPEATPSDEESAFGASFALTGNDDEVIPHIGWMHVITTRLLVDHADSLRRLAEALVVTEVMDAETFVRIVHAGRCRCHFWRSVPATNERTPAMPAPRKRTTKPAPGVYIATQTASVDLGDLGDTLIVAGETRVPADHRLMTLIPGLFELDGTGSERLSEPWITLKRVPPVDPIRLLEPIPSERRVRATRYVVVNGVQLAAVGQLFDSASGLAQAIERELPGVLVPEPDEPV
jgi:hypothetical protein